MVAGGLLAGLWSGACAQSASNANGGTHSIYTCVDKQGRKLTSDRPIAECIDREQRELGPSGTVRRILGPSLTDDERIAQEVRRRKDQEERLRQVEERRRERVLTTRYPDKATHDIERTAAIDLVDEVSNAATKHILLLREQRKGLEVEMEFYRKNPSKAPMALRRQLAENDESVQEQQRFLGSQAQEKRRIHQRFDTELEQLQRLWAAQQTAPAPAPADVPVVVAPGR
ncbi:hypothetical protein [Simplicispira psychrophila]|uniref:hypothetical protein n=1 Tax=Simplicispira psychrophila TaxID=80882 RepID=UPI00055C352E